MRTIKINWFAVALVAVLIFVGTPHLPTVQADSTTPVERTISVTGQAQVNVPPDQVILTLGIETQDKDFDTAKRANDQRLAQLLNLIKTANIPANQVRTDFIGVSPFYPYRSDNLYDVRKTIVVTLTDLSTFESFLTAAIGTGATSVQSIQFRTTELRKYKDQARSMAIQAAKEKAEALAGELGEKIGRPTHINEDQLGWYSYYDFYNGWGQQYGGYSNQMNAVQNVSQAPSSSAASGANSDEPASPGEISVTASVSVTFDLAN